MRILVLFAQHHWTGPAEPVMQKLEFLRQQGHAIFFCYSRKPAGTLPEVVRRVGFDSLDDVTLYRRRPAPFRYFRDVATLTTFCRHWKPDVVHCHLSHDHWTGIGLRARIEQRPLFVRSIHESRKLQPRWAERLLFARTDAFLVPSDRFATELVGNFSVDSLAVQTIPGVVDAQRFSPELDTAEVFRELGAPPNTPLIGIVSRIKPGRGHAKLIAAFRKVAPDHPSAQLLIVGKGEAADDLKKRNDDLVQSRRLRFLGYRTRDLPNILNALTAKVLLGEGSDGTCRAVLEAMACQTPVVAAEVGVLPETVEDGKTGLLVRPDDPQFLEVALRSVLENPERMEQMGQAARQVILEKHTVEQAAKRQEAFFQRRIAERKT